MNIRPYHDSDEQAVIQVWIECGLVAPQNNPVRDIQRKSKVNPDWFLVGIAQKKVIASCMVGYEGHRGWINYLAVSPTEQRKGYAKRMMEEAERLLREAGCPKINLQVRSSNPKMIAFYERIGFSDDRVTSLGKRLETDKPYAVERQPAKAQKEIEYSFTDTLSDDEVIGLYDANGWSSAQKPEILMRALRGSHSLVTARHGSKLVGLGNAISDGHLVVYYPHLLVHPDYQRKGIGKGIMNEMKARYGHFHQQQLTADGNAITFYESIGFERSGKTEPMWIYQGDEH